MMHLFTDGHIAEKPAVERLPFEDVAREMVIRVEDFKREKLRIEREKATTGIT